MSLIYAIPIVLSIVWSLRYDGQEEFDERKSHRYWLLCVVLSLIAGLSYALGGDKQAYLTEFNDYSSDLSDVLQEIELGITDRGQMPGWVLTNVLSKALLGSFYAVQLTEAFFVNIVVFYTCKRYTQHIFLTVLLYCLTFQYFNFNTEVMREAFAIGFCLLGAEMLLRSRRVLAALLFCMAFMFHASAIAMILLFPLMRFRITTRRFPLILLAALGVWLVGNHLFTFIIDIVLGQQGAFVAKALDYGSFSTGFVAFCIFAAIYLVAPYVIMRLAIETGAQDQDTLRRKEQFLTYYLCIAIVVPTFLPLARFQNYTMPLLLCLTADLLYTLFGEKRGFLLKLPCILLFWGYTLIQYTTFVPKTGSSSLILWFPYTSIIDEDAYDRSPRQDFHTTITNGEKEDENTRVLE